MTEYVNKVLIVSMYNYVITCTKCGHREVVGRDDCNLETLLKEKCKGCGGDDNETSI